MVISIFEILEVNRATFARLARAENKQKSALSDKTGYLVGDEQAVGKCLHPPNRMVHRANQYAFWTVCLNCKARLSYRSKRTSTALGRKGTGRSLTQAAPSQLHYVPTVPETADQSSGSAATPAGPMPPVNSDMTQMLGMLHSALTDIARGQTQILMIMGQDPNSVQTEAQASNRQEMDTQSWEAMSNPNLSPAED